jgi:D-aspartate ligase
VHQPDELARFLIEEGRQLDRPGILFPASDAFVLFLSRYRDDLAPCFRFALPPADVLEAMVNKRRQYEMAEQVGTPYAITRYPETMEDVQRIKEQVDYPAFIKPYYGHLWRERFGGAHKGFKVHTPEELIARFEEILPTGLQVMVQSIILGPNTNHFKVSAYMGQTGEPLAVFTLRKIRQYPTEFGVGTVVESLHYPELVELGLTFFRGIGYRGIGSIEFKRDDRDGVLKMIELNPRLWQQNIQATDCGMNFPLIQYLDLTGQTPAPQTEFKEGVRWFDAMADFQSFWSYYRQGELSPPAWVRSWIGARSFTTFALDDLGPFFKANEFGLKYLRAPLYALRHQKQ